MNEKPNQPMSVAGTPHKGMTDRPWKQPAATPVRRPGTER